MKQTAISNPRPSVQFSHDDSLRGRDHIAHPISGSQKPVKSTSAIPLTKTSTTESSKSHRSSLSLSAFADRLRSHSRSRSRSKNRNSLEVPDVDEVDEFKYTRRRSSEIGGDYADVARAQALFMDKLREEQFRNHITHNVDGLPIPPPIERERRSSSLTRILGMDKPLLSR
ncbi:hypothetical protein BGZ65_008437 [Modicella reniformis]|uniref:Uncharacterized protein n=1 Tax=Modicella reniformis TaxID=1440133 RepID=A0A9P6JGM6_9FUNG|nr:hypothetical protein BGZ65_008437 [Modicella reniformis]